MLSTVKLDMYDFPQIADWTDRWVNLLSQCLRVPQSCNLRDDEMILSELGARNELYAGQTCGWPLILSENVYQVVAIPKYTVIGCEKHMYRSIIIATSTSSCKTLSDFVGKGFKIAVNSRTSCSGLLLFAASVGCEVMKVANVITTGSHLDSIDFVGRGEADIASIDCVTFHLLKTCRPDLIAKVKVIGCTVAAPALPYVTSYGASEAEVEGVRNQLRSVLGTEEGVQVASKLCFGGFVDNAAHLSSEEGIDTSSFMAYYCDHIKRLRIAATSNTLTVFDNFVRDFHNAIDWRSIDFTFTTMQVPESRPAVVPTALEWREHLLGLQPGDTGFVQSCFLALRRYVRDLPGTAAGSSGYVMQWKVLDKKLYRFVLPAGAAAFQDFLQHFEAHGKERFQVVCFLGHRKAVQDCVAEDDEVVRRCWSVDAELVKGLDPKVVVCYATVETAPGGDWGNIVVFDRNRQIASDAPFSCPYANSLHSKAIAEIAPQYYSSVRIHRCNAALLSADCEPSVELIRTLSVQYGADGVVRREVIEW